MSWGSSEDDFSLSPFRGLLVRRRPSQAYGTVLSLASVIQYIALFLESERNDRCFAGSPNSRFQRHAAVTAVKHVLTRAFSAPQAKKLLQFGALFTPFSDNICQSSTSNPLKGGPTFLSPLFLASPPQIAV